jgi:2-polyprenyl-3-methyl-5-hydroxy-6-metoxy-1,4-benzoquinol methylase
MESNALVDRNLCPMCGSERHRVHMAFPEIPVVKCAVCDFMWSSKILPERMLTAYYEKNFGGERQLQGQIVNSKVNAWAVGKLLKGRPISSILDVGTGYGFLLKELCKARKLDAAGVELSKQEADYAKETLGLNVTNAFLKDSGLPREHFDLVTCFEVIEHIPDPREFISELAGYVRPNGYLLIMTDNFESRMAKVLGAGFPKWIPHEHISHFSPSTLQRALARATGMSLVKSMSFTPWEVLLRASYYKLRGLKKTPYEAFDLASQLKREMSGSYKLFALRKFFNKTWAQFTLADKMDGDLMYFLLTKAAAN